MTVTREGLAEAIAKAVEHGRACGFESAGSPEYHSYCCCGALTKARAALTAIEALGYAVVPVEPTEEMVTAGVTAEGDENLAVETRNIWTAMLAAAPKLEQAADGDGRGEEHG